MSNNDNQDSFESRLVKMAEKVPRKTAEIGKTLAEALKLIGLYNQLNSRKMRRLEDGVRAIRFAVGAGETIEETEGSSAEMIGKMLEKLELLAGAMGVKFEEDGLSQDSEVRVSLNRETLEKICKKEKVERKTELVDITDDVTAADLAYIAKLCFTEDRLWAMRGVKTVSFFPRQLNSQNLAEIFSTRVPEDASREGRLPTILAALVLRYCEVMVPRKFLLKDFYVWVVNWYKNYLNQTLIRYYAEGRRNISLPDGRKVNASLIYKKTVDRTMDFVNSVEIMLFKDLMELKRMEEDAGKEGMPDIEGVYPHLEVMYETKDDNGLPGIERSWYNAVKADAWKNKTDCARLDEKFWVTGSYVEPGAPTICHDRVLINQKDMGRLSGKDHGLIEDVKYLCQWWKDTDEKILAFGRVCVIEIISKVRLNVYDRRKKKKTSRRKKKKAPPAKRVVEEEDEDLDDDDENITVRKRKRSGAVGE